MVHQLKQLDRAKVKDLAHIAHVSKRAHEIERAWVRNKYLLVKCGHQVSYIDRSQNSLLMSPPVQKINFNLGPDVWIDGIYATYYEDLVQFVVIDDANKRLYLITWNLDHNREHSIYETTVPENVQPENMYLRGLSFDDSKNFNLVLSDGGVTSLENNIPCQFFDPTNDAFNVPRGFVNAVGVPG